MNGNRFLSIIFVIIAILAFVNSFEYPVESTIYVRFILAVFFILSVALFFAKPKNEKPLKGLITDQRIKALLLITAYIILMPILGFFISTFVFAITFMFVFNSKGIVKYVISSGVFTLTMYLLFNVLLKIWFPTGLLF